jgi:hypothetical protein
MPESMEHARISSSHQTAILSAQVRVEANATGGPTSSLGHTFRRLA